MKSGFMLIELIVATLIASLISAVLMTALYQGSRFQVIVDNLVNTSIRVGTVAYVFERDLIGSFVPVQAKIREKKQQEGEQKATNNKEKEEEADEDEAGVIAKKNKPAPKPIEKIFYSTNKDKHLDAVTFITNNPMKTFVGKDVGTIKPKVVRVRYVVKQEEEKDSFALFRQESTELDLNNFKNVREYEVIGGIKEITIMFTARIEKKEESKASSEQAVAEGAQKKEASKKEELKTIGYEYKTMAEWSSEPKEQTDKKQAEMPRIPYFVEIKLTLWNKEHTNSQDFVLLYEIPTNTVPSKLPKQKVPKAEKKKTEGKEGEGVSRQRGTGTRPAKIADNNAFTIKNNNRFIQSANNIVKNIINQS